MADAEGQNLAPCVRIGADRGDRRHSARQSAPRERLAFALLRRHLGTVSCHIDGG